MNVRPLARITAHALLVAVLLGVARPASADTPDAAAPLPSKDLRWYVSEAAVVDVGSLPRASTGLALGGGVRRGGLGASVFATGLLAHGDEASRASTALYELMTMICALGPLGSGHVGACGGVGAGLLRAVSSVGGVETDVVRVRPEGLAMARLDVRLGRSAFLSADAGAIVAPFSPTLRVEGGTDFRPSPFAFRGSLGLHLRFW